MKIIYYLCHKKKGGKPTKNTIIMKSFISKVACASLVCLLFGVNMNAQSLKSIVSSAVSSVTSSVTTTSTTIVGTWAYSAPKVEFDSDNLLASAGGTVAASTVETQLETYYTSLGLNSSSFVFDSSLNFTISTGKLSATGTYVFDSSAKTITMTVSKLNTSIVGYVSVTGSTMYLTFEADKLLTLAKSLGSATADYSSTISTLSTLAENYDGMKLGFTLTKQ